MIGRIEVGMRNSEVGNNLNSEIRIHTSAFVWACSSVWLERTPDKREVDGSTPSRPTISTGKNQYEYFRGCSSAGRAPALHAGGHRFEPVHLHQKITRCHMASFFWLRWKNHSYSLFDNLDIDAQKMFSMIVSIILWPSY